MVSLRALLASIVSNPSKMTKRDGFSLLGYGGMRMPTTDGGHANSWAKEGYSASDIDQPRLNAQVKLMLDGGINVFDTSPAYCRGESERRLGEALAASGRPRESYFLSSKLSNFAKEQWSAEASKAMFEKTLENLRTDYLDVYLIHNVGGENFDNRFVGNGMLDWLFEQKRLGRIRRIGFSIHGDRPRFEWLMKQHDVGRYQWDVALIQTNYVDWHHAAKVNKRNVHAEFYYRELDRRGIRMMVMEPLLGGQLANPPEAVLRELRSLDAEATPASWAFRFCGSHPDVLTVLSGMREESHIRENLATFSPLKPLTNVERVTLERAAAEFVGFGAVPCTHCSYCMPCPYGLDIPSLFHFFNEVRTKKLGDRKEIRRLYEKMIPDPRRRADRCIGCERCVPHCPQHINVPKMLDTVAAFVEEYA